MLSLPDNWDYTLFGLSTISTDGLSSIRAAVNELEEAGYLKRRRLRNDKGQLTETEYTILEQPEQLENTAKQPICDFPTLEKPTLENPMLDFPTLGKPTLENRTQLNTNISNTEQSKTDLSSIHPSIPSGHSRQSSRPRAERQPGRMDMMDEMEAYREIIHENIEYEIHVEHYGSERIDELVQLMLDAICTRSPTVRIDRADFPSEVVKSRLLKVGFSHIEYVLDCLDKTTTKIHNIRSYLLTALYNSTVTMDSYYRAAVSHDLYGGP